MLSEERVSEPPSDEEEEVEVEEFVHNGVTYLKSTKGVVYDIESSEEIGKWEEVTGIIVVE